MARPKCTKKALSITTTGAVESAPTSQVKQKHATKSPSTSERGTNGSDDSDGLVTTSKTKVNRRGAPAQEATMSGALPSEDVLIEGKRVRPVTGRKRAALSKVAREADHARAIEALRARREAAMATEKGEKVEIPSSMPEKTITSNIASATPAKEPVTSVGAALATATEQLMPGTVQKTRQPQRAESSTISASAFKKRPRQPSLLQLIRSQNQYSSPVSDEDDDLGDDLDDFNPIDTSTPFPKPLAQSSIPQSPLGSSSSPRQSSGSKKRKLSVPEIHVLASQILPAQVSSPSPLPDDDLYGVSSENEEPEITLPSTNPVCPKPSLPPRSNRTQTPQIWVDTQAPPRSSSSPQLNSSPEATLPKKSSKPRTTNKALSLDPSPVSLTSSSPALAHASRPLKPLSTATLQNLLPRRRLRSRPKPAAGAFDVPSSDVPTSDVESIARDEDEDELSFHTTAQSKKKPQDRRTTTLSKSRKSQPAKSSKTATSKTYTRKKPPVLDHSGSEDEDSEILVLSIKTAPAKEADRKQQQEAKKKLQRVKLHFQEVDEWELEVEEVTGEGSSQVDAR